VKTQVLTAVATLGLAASAMAQVEVRFTGSTAFRATTYAAIRSMYGADLTSQNPAHDASGQNRVTWSGTIPALYGGQTVVVRANYSGSVEGIQSVTQGLNDTFLASANAGDTATITGQADFAFSDVFQDTTDFTSPSLDDKQVGVVCFAWTRSLNTPTTVNNMTHQTAQTFLANGALPLSFFTGDSADDGKLIYLTGRSKGSGTRATCQADCGYGANADCQLYKLDAGNAWIPDNVGFSSGSGVAGVLKVNDAGNISLGYLGISDSNGVNGGANKVSFNGVPFSQDAVRKGQYSSWGYEHLFAKPGASANALKFRDGTANNGLVKATDDTLATSVANVQLSTMKVSRNADGGPISP
jgi:hypothetical protein